jgi:ABC-type antimicrobial peptide transport system ATPase subunit
MNASDLCAQQLAKVFMDAGWKVSLRKEEGDLIEHGLRINFFMKDNQRPSGVNALMETLGQIGRHTTSVMENIDHKMS